MALYLKRSLFGGELGWNATDWTASDDRVRGGQSQSYLKIHDDLAIFCGNLDIDTLGGAGFASQRTTGDDRHWNLASYDAIELTIDPAASDNKKYTFIVKDTILPPNPENGREQSTISWEYEFEVPQTSNSRDTSHLSTIVIPWRQLTPTYRGKEKQPERPLDPSDIRRISIMMRSYFGDQKGQFTLCLANIAAVKIDDKLNGSSISITSNSIQSEKNTQHPTANTSRIGLWSRILSACNKL